MCLINDIDLYVKVNCSKFILKRKQSVCTKCEMTKHMYYARTTIPEIIMIFQYITTAYKKKQFE